jgi:hypothetical protein
MQLKTGYAMNDGAVPVLADDARVALVDCQTDFKRGQGWKAKCITRDANARLIAAAPDMLAALRAVLDHLHIAMQGPDFAETAILDAFDAAKEAIAKAEAVS